MWGLQFEQDYNRGKRLEKSRKSGERFSFKDIQLYLVFIQLGSRSPEVPGV